MHGFEYAAPASVADAVAALAKEDAKLLAGGQTLLPTMKQRLAAPTVLVDLRKVEGLSGISREGELIVIGAMTRHADVAASPVVHDAIKGLGALAGMIGDPAVRHRGTIGGSLANNDPAADYPAAALALGATIVTNKREIKADDFFQGLFTTALDDQEIITKVKFPIPEKSGYEKFRNPASRYAMVGVFVAKTKGGVRVAVTGAGSDGVFRHAEMETALASNFSADAIKSVKTDASKMLSDLHGDADYRAHLVNVMARRALASAT
jgi:carbon-monoxide dehydrogenase medium subunit